MHIRLKTINGEELRMEIEMSSQVSQFRQEVGQKLNVESERVRLIYAGQVLSDANSLGKYDMTDDSVIHAVIRPVTSVPSAAAPAHSSNDTSSDMPSLTFVSGVNGSQPSNMRGSSTATGSGPRATMSPQEMEFANGMGRFMVGSMSMSMEEMGGEGNSHSGGPPNMDAIMSDIFGRSMAEAMNSSSDPSGRSRAPTGNPSHGRISVLRAKESFGTSIESGLSSIRIISEGLRRGTTSATPAFEDIEPREEDPSVAVAQMLSELGTTLSALKVPVMKMSKEMQTGSFTQQCPSASQRINKLTEITNLKTALQNLTNASQHAARALALLTLESVPGVQPPLRTARPFAAAAAANAAATAAHAAAAAASAATDTTAAKPAATPANSTKLATGFLNSKPGKKVPTPASGGIEGQKMGADCDNTASEGVGKSTDPSPALKSNTKTHNPSVPKPVAATPAKGQTAQQQQQQQQQRGSSGCPFPLPIPSPFCPFHSGNEDDDSENDTDDAEEEHARMAFIHMLRNSGPAGELHLAMMMKGSQEREAEERKRAKAAKWQAVKAKKVAEAKRKSDLADAAKAAADKIAATGAGVGGGGGKVGQGSSLPLPTASNNAGSAITAPAFSTGLLPDLIPVNGSLSASAAAAARTSGATAGAAVAVEPLVQSGASPSAFSTAPTAGSSTKGAKSKGANWVPRGRRSSDLAVTHKGRKYNAARPMPQTSHIPSPAPSLFAVGTGSLLLSSLSDTPSPPLALLFPPSTTTAAATTTTTTATTAAATTATTAITTAITTAATTATTAITTAAITAAAITATTATAATTATTAPPMSLMMPSSDAALLSPIVTKSPLPCRDSRSPTPESTHPVDMMSFTASISATPLTPLSLSMGGGPRPVTLAVNAPDDHVPSSTAPLALSGVSDGGTALALEDPTPVLRTVDPSIQGTSFVNFEASAPAASVSVSVSALDSTAAVALPSHTASTAIEGEKVIEGEVEVGTRVVGTSNAQAAPAVPGVSGMDNAEGVHLGVKSGSGSHSDIGSNSGSNSGSGSDIGSGSSSNSGSGSDSGSGSGSGSDAIEGSREGRAGARTPLGCSTEGRQQVSVASPTPAAPTEIAVTAQSAVECVDTVKSPAVVCGSASSVQQCVAASEPSSVSTSGSASAPGVLHTSPLPSNIHPAATAAATAATAIVSDTPQSIAPQPPTKATGLGTGGCTQQ